MFAFLRRLFFFSSKKRYEADKEILETGDEAARKKLAEDPHTSPEMLYFMAEDPSDKVREAVAGNTATPLQISEKLAKDENADVRNALAGRLVKLLPGLSTPEHGQLFGFAVQALAILAEDEMLKIRRALSTGLQDMGVAPPHVMAKLAADVEREVSENLLRYCKVISDKDLLAILAHHPESWAVQAVAQRGEVGEELSEGIFKTLDVMAGKLLLQNRGAVIAPETLEEIVDYARDCLDWHDSIALHPSLTFELTRKLVGYAGKTVFSLLQKRKDFDKQTSADIVALVKRRIEFQENTAEGDVKKQVAAYKKSGKLGTETLLDALAWQNIKFVEEALHQMTGVKIADIHAAAAKHDAAFIVALCWKAGLQMRLALELQKKLAGVQPRNLIYARGGTDYPLEEDEMKKILHIKDG
ncbi:MAG: DUF2336 domain-containing protein [Pseudomonadota bacterium]|nr:DUF2336 domain-containing protein [Pseudomonadota bacterium]QKK06273.1 MAG: DUF2336 domain-containing protein [Pseudomonadota bacterium]